MPLMYRTGSVLLVALIALAIPAALAQTTATMVTFSDPALDATTPVFSLVGNQFQGGWSGLGLDLLTPGLPLTGDIPNAKFTMTPLIATQIIPGYLSLSGGTIDFLDPANTLIFQITFQSASLAPNIGFGASDLALQGVTFFAPLEPPQFDAQFGEERFAFSFANDAEIPQSAGSTWTASFTSSSALIPEPASAGLLVGGGLLVTLLRRRA
jgi:hypothetical protein